MQSWQRNLEQDLTAGQVAAWSGTVGTDGAIDIATLKQKYAEERAKRLRPDGNDQYLQLKGQLAHYLDDPYTPFVERERRPTTSRWPSSAAASPASSPALG